MISIPDLDGVCGLRETTRGMMYLHPAGDIMRALEKALDKVFGEPVEIGGFKIQPCTLCPPGEAWLFDHDGKLHRVVMEGKAK